MRLHKRIDSEVKIPPLVFVASRGIGATLTGVLIENSVQFLSLVNEKKLW